MDIVQNLAEFCSCHVVCECMYVCVQRVQKFHVHIHPAGAAKETNPPVVGSEWGGWWLDTYTFSFTLARSLAGTHNTNMKVYEYKNKAFYTLNRRPS